MAGSRYSNSQTESGKDDNNLNYTPRSYRANTIRGPRLPTEGGISEDAGIFGPVVKRRIDFASNNQRNVPKVAKPHFQHTNAIYLRYVNSEITAEKMMGIIKRNPILKEAVENDPNAIEINRLVKNSLTEEQIANFKSGVSYRIGCTDQLMGALMDRSNWATHWELRQWDPIFKEQIRNKNSNVSPVIDLTVNDNVQTQKNRNVTTVPVEDSMEIPTTLNDGNNSENESKN